MNLFRKPSLSRERVEALKYEAMIVRNERRLAEAKAALKARGVEPMSIGRWFVPANVARSFSRGL
jgi:hypothetical protein